MFFKIDMCYFSSKNATLSIESKDWLTPYQDNVSGWSDMFTLRLFFSELILSKSN